MFSVTKLKTASATLHHAQTQIERIRDLFARDDEGIAARLDRITALIEREWVALEREIDAFEGKDAA